jgi:hypothetical protein
MTLWIVATLTLALALAGIGGCAWLAVSNARRALEVGLASTQAEVRRIADSAAGRDSGAADVRREIQAFRESIDLMQARERERRAREDQAWASLQRVTSVLAGGQRSGRAGENVLREALASLPPSMVVTDFRVNGRVVEFGLVLPDGRRLAVDSKWTADRELQDLAAAADPADRERLIRSVESEVVRRAKEVAGYLDPAVTAPLAVAAVPDAAYAVLRRAHADAYRFGVVVISYSQALPFVLFLFGVMSRLGGAADAQACLADMAALVDAMEATVENKLARAATMLVNGTEELRGHVGKARSTITRASSGESGRTGGPEGPGDDRPVSPLDTPLPGLLIVEPGTGGGSADDQGYVHAAP